jgi:hypothetical protein
MYKTSIDEKKRQKIFPIWMYKVNSNKTSNYKNMFQSNKTRKKTKIVGHNFTKINDLVNFIVL